MQNEYIASYLSTLGGAYSALGDYYEEHVRKTYMHNIYLKYLTKTLTGECRNIIGKLRIYLYE